ncbi:MAG: hypothetical protein FWF82_06475 [Oscillospiraceae bacterium]|nr:hypothetical protein [Oscillospiraceae bacterium]
MKSLIFKITIIAVILIAGWIAVFNIPEAVESFLPAVDTLIMSEVNYCESVSGTGVIYHTPDGWFITVSVDEGNIRKVELGQTADISGAAFDKGIYTATVHDISDVATIQQGAFVQETVVEVTLKIDNPDNALRSGYTSRADIKTDEVQTIYIVPYSAILQDESGEYVYILMRNSAVRRDILTGIELAEGAQVVAGLRNKDRVIANPGAVSDNALVRESLREEVGNV